MLNLLGMVNYPAGNSYAYFRDRYGVGPEDFGTRPYVQPYAQAFLPLPISQDTFVKEKPMQKLKRLAHN